MGRASDQFKDASEKILAKIREVSRRIADQTTALLKSDIRGRDVFPEHPNPPARIDADGWRPR